jgi:hypothetical protein
MHLSEARNGKQKRVVEREKGKYKVEKEGGKNEVNSYRTGAVWMPDC